MGDIMCGRFTLRTPASRVADLFSVLIEEPWQPRYNIAPTQWIPAVRCQGTNRQICSLHWGLIPSWATERRVGASMINARAETVAVKPAFRHAFRRKRCLIPGDGFYEWQRIDSRTKVPHLFELQDESPFAFAGLWEQWKSSEGEVIESCSIITTAANSLVESVHDRMPVILSSKYFDEWLDPEFSDVDRLMPMLAPFAASRMKATQVSNIINNARNEINPLIATPKK